jgi:D-glycero-alpha-D-manno-heptose-7-phosphate kinase
MVVRTKAPTRIDLAGGTLDIWPVHQLVPQSSTVNIGVSLWAETVIKPSIDGNFHIKSQDLGIEEAGDFRTMLRSTKLPLFAEILRELWQVDFPPLTIVTNASSPAGAGLGGSSCLSLTLVQALINARAEYTSAPFRELNDHGMVQLVQDIEARLIWAPTGVQDYWGALRGGVNILTFPAGEVQVETLRPEAVVGLEEQLLLCYSGKSRASAGNNWQVYKALLEKDKNVFSVLFRIAEKAAECAQAIRKGDLGTALLISKAEWGERKKLWPDITTPETESIEAAALSAGAHFARVCGAGGGGVIAIFVPPEKREEVKDAVIKKGAVPLDAAVARTGLESFQERP